MLRQVYTIRELLLSPTMLGNQTKLAKMLRIDRMTLGKYRDDVENKYHCILRADEGFIFMASGVSK